MKKLIIPAVALLFCGAAANAQLATTPKGVTPASNKTAVHKPAKTTAQVSPAKTTGAAGVTNSNNNSKTAIKRKHPKTKKAKAKKTM